MYRGHNGRDDIAGLAHSITDDLLSKDFTLSAFGANLTLTGAQWLQMYAALGTVSALVKLGVQKPRAASSRSLSRRRHEGRPDHGDPRRRAPRARRPLPGCGADARNYRKSPVLIGGTCGRCGRVWLPYIEFGKPVKVDVDVQIVEDGPAS